MKVLAVGDIHTKMWIIEEVEKLIDEYDKVVFIGDYADNWGTSPQMSILTWEAIRRLTLEYPTKVIAMIGNHDYAYILSVPPFSSGHNPMTQVMLNADRELKNWLRELPVVQEIDGVTYSHAGVDVSWNEKLNETSLWADNSPIWVRPDHAMYGPEPQVIGHTPQRTINEVHDGIWGIDTFSTYPDGTNIGDQTVLEIINGEKFNIKSLKNENNNTASSIENEVS